MNHIGRTCISSRTHQFSCILWVWVTARLDVFFKLLNVTKTINIFLIHFRSAANLLQLAIVHAALPLPKFPLISSHQEQKVWPRIIVANFTKWFQSIFTAGWRMYNFNLPSSAPAYTYTASLQCNFCIPNCLATFVLWLLSVMPLSSVFSQSKFSGLKSSFNRWN